jgi:heptosyltransferase-2
MPSNTPRILIFRNGSIGNTLVAIPAIRALRRAFPNANITAILDSVGEALLKHCPYIDEILIYEKQRKHKGVLANISFIFELRRRHPTHAILFKRFFRNGLLAYLSGAKERIGFRTLGKAPFLNRTIPYEEGRDIIALNLELAVFAGAKNTLSRELELWFDAETESETNEYLSKYRLKEKEYVAVCLGGVTSPPDYLSSQAWQSILSCISEHVNSLVFLGAASEKELAERISPALRNNVVLAFDLPILVTADIIRRARLFAGTNSGLAHISNAVQTPGIIFFRPEKNVHREIEKWCPKGDNYHSLVPPTEPNQIDSFLQDVQKAIAEVLQ